MGKKNVLLSNNFIWEPRVRQFWFHQYVAIAIEEKSQHTYATRARP